MHRILLATALLAGPVVVALPARAATGPAAVSTHDRAQPVFDVSSDPSGTVFVVDGAVRLVRAPLAPGAPEVALGSRGPGSAGYPAQDVSIRSGRVAIPVLPTAGALATTVRWCLVADCPTTSTLTAPAGYRYLGNAGDVAILHNPSTNTLALDPWTGGPLTSIPLGNLPAPLGAWGDATGIALWHPSSAAYVDRASHAVTTLPGRLAYLTPSSVVFAAGSPGAYTVRRVPRTAPGSASTIEATVTIYDEDPVRLVATDDAAAWTVLLPWAQRSKNATQLGTVRTLAFGGTPADSGRVEWNAVAPLENGTTFVVHRDGAGGRGFYAITPGTTAATLVHALPAVPATVRSLAIANGRLAFADDSAPGGAGYVRDVDGGVPGAETLVRTLATDVALSARYVTVLHEDQPVTEVVASGHRLVLTTGGQTYLDGAARGYVVGAVYGDDFYAADRNGGVARRDLGTGALTTVRTGSRGGYCGASESSWQVSAWGDDVLYALDLGTHGRVTGLWHGATRATTPLPMLGAGWTRLAYRDGLLLVYRAGAGVHLYDLRANTDAVVDPTGTLPSGFGLDASLVAWADASGRAVVEPVADFLPAYAAETRRTNAVTPAGLGPDLTRDGHWDAEWYFTGDTTWQLALTSGATTVRTFSGTTTRGTAAVSWDGTDGSAQPLPDGWYAWTLSTPAGDQSGRVYLSTTTPPTPALHAPTLTSDLSATDRFTVTWSGAPPGDDYMFVGPTNAPHTTHEIATFSRLGPGTYRMSVWARDPAGRLSVPADRTTVTPYDDTKGGGTVPAHWSRTYDSRLWLGSQTYSTLAGARYSAFVPGDGIWVVGTRGPAYGRYRVTVDGRSWTYDAYAPRLGVRQVLFRLGGLVDYQVHHVVVEVLATPGRTKVGIDAIGARRSGEIYR